MEEMKSKFKEMDPDPYSDHKLRQKQIEPPFDGPVLVGSKCTNEEKEKNFLKKLFRNKVFVTTMLFQGSRDGWKGIDFHSRCDGLGPTLSLFRVKDGPCIGGFTAA